MSFTYLQRDRTKKTSVSRWDMNKLRLIQFTTSQQFWNTVHVTSGLIKHQKKKNTVNHSLTYTHTRGAGYLWAIILLLERFGLRSVALMHSVSCLFQPIQSAQWSIWSTANLRHSLDWSVWQYSVILYSHQCHLGVKTLTRCFQSGMKRYSYSSW